MIGRRLHLIVPGSLDQKTGGYLYCARVVERLRERGWQIDVHELPGSFPDADRTARSALEAALASLPDGAVAVIDGLAMGGLPAPVSAHGRRVTILSLVHHPLADETGLDADERRGFERSERSALGASAGVIATSAFTARRLGAYGVEPGRLRVVPPGTEPAPLAGGPGADAPPALLCVATVTPRKGHEVLAGALARLDDLAWSCTCVGSLERAPRHARSVLERVATAGLTGRIRFTGEVDDARLQELYDRSSIFVLASHYEGYGMVLTEALARGLPVVSTTAGAIPDTVPREAGVLVPPASDIALAEAIGDLLRDPERRRAAATAAAAYARSLPDWDETAAAFETAVLELAR